MCEIQRLVIIKPMSFYDFQEKLIPFIFIIFILIRSRFAVKYFYGIKMVILFLLYKSQIFVSLQVL